MTDSTITTATAVTTATATTSFEVEKADLLAALSINKKATYHKEETSAATFRTDNAVFIAFNRDSISVKSTDRTFTVEVDDIPAKVEGVENAPFMKLKKLDILQNVLTKCTGDIKAAIRGNELLDIENGNGGKYSVLFSNADCLKERFQNDSQKWEKLFEIDGDILAEMFQKINGIIPHAEKDNRFHGVLFDVANNKLKITAGCGYMFGTAENFLNAADTNFILPLKGVSILNYFLNIKPSDDLIEVYQNKEDEQIKFVQKSSFTTSIIMETPPVSSCAVIALKKFFLDKYTGAIRIKTRDLKSALNTCGIIKGGKVNALFETSRDKGGILLKSISEDFGTISTFIRAKISGDLNFVVTVESFKDIISNCREKFITVKTAEKQGIKFLEIITDKKSKYLLGTQKENQQLINKNPRQLQLIFAKTAKLNELRNILAFQKHTALEPLYAKSNELREQLEKARRSKSKKAQEEFNNLCKEYEEFEKILETEVNKIEEENTAKYNELAAKYDELIKQAA